jgi:hypothetical protein
LNNKENNFCPDRFTAYRGFLELNHMAKEKTFKQEVEHFLEVIMKKES